MGQTLFFSRKREKISTVQENSHDCEGWIAAATPVRSTATRLHPGGAVHKVAAEVWLIGGECFRVLAFLCLSSLFGPLAFNFAPRRNILSLTKEHATAAVGQSSIQHNWTLALSIQLEYACFWWTFSPAQSLSSNLVRAFVLISESQHTNTCNTL